jgi:hypothetical protein
MTRHAEETLAFAKAHCTHHVEIGAYDNDGCQLLIGECCTIDVPEVGVFALKMDELIELKFHTLDEAICAAEAIEDGIQEAKSIAHGSAMAKCERDKLARQIATVAAGVA